MANLGTKTLTNTEYQKAEDLFGIVFVAGTVYTLQSRNDSFVCVSVAKPKEEEGFLINTGNDYVKYEHKDDGSTLWVKTSITSSIFNIGE